MYEPLDVIIPVRNEAAHLAASVEAVLAQDYPGPLTICLAVGPSTDGTEQVAAELARRHPQVQVTANPSGRTPAALNAALAATSSEIVARVDGHCALSPDYLRTAVEVLTSTGAVNVGGLQDARGTTSFTNTVAAAMRSRLGTGGARFHTGGSAGPVDTVYLGVFRRSALDAAGGFDERLTRNQDYELNIRLRAAGGTVWFDPRLTAAYRPRPSFGALARQYFEYGRWKRAVVHLHPSSLRPRQAVPAAVTAAVGAGLLAAPVAPAALAAPATYAAGVILGGATVDRAHPLRAAAVLATMHLAWGAGFLTAAPRRMLGAAPRTSPPSALAAVADDTSPEVSVIVLTMGDRPVQLAAALASIESQRGVRAETIVVLNGVADAASVAVPVGVRVVQLSENVGVPAGRNVGVAAASAPVLAFLDDDAVFLDPDTLARTVADFAADGRLGVVGWRLVDEATGVTQRRHNPRLTQRGVTRAGPVAVFLAGAVAIRRAAFVDAGGYADGFRFGMEETDLAWRLADAGWTLAYRPAERVGHPPGSPQRGVDTAWMTARNRAWAAHRNLPAPIAVAHVASRLAITALRTRGRALRPALAGTRAALAQPLGPRRPIRWRTVLELTRRGRPPIV